MIDLEELERQYSPFKEVPIHFVEYPQVNKLMAAVPGLIEELRAAREFLKWIKDETSELMPNSGWGELSLINEINKRACKVMGGEVTNGNS